MGFAITVPNANQSPAVFPTQMNNNLQRIFDVVNANHVFNTTAQDNDGCHKKVTFINLVPDPATLPAGTNAIAFSKFDSQSRSQLFWYNGVQTEQVTSREDITTYRVQGSSLSAVPANTAINVPGMPAEYVATGWAIINGTVGYTYQNLIVFLASTDEHTIDSNNAGNTPPTFEYVGTQLKIRNNSSSALILQWSLMVNKFS